MSMAGAASPKPMRYLFGDFETYYDRNYTLKKLTTEAYIRDERFQALCFCGYYPATGETFKLLGPANIRSGIADIDWNDIYFVSHHSQFDGLILSHHFNAVPRMFGCTLSMARTISRSRTGSSLSLAALAERIGSHPKTVNYNVFFGKKYAELTEVEINNLAEQCLEDCRLTYDIWHWLINDMSFPHRELVIVDETIKMFADPQIIGDIDLFEYIANEEISRKQTILAQLGLTRAQLASTNQCKEIIESYGIDVPMKAGKNGPIPALAKSDDFLQSLLESDDEQLRTIAEARRDVKSTLIETRSQRLAETARRGAIPIYLRYCGAHTTRWSGGDKSNAQNYTRKSKLRSGLCAPTGKVFIIVDYKQIEARLLLRLAGQFNQLDLFTVGDPYVAMAERLYGKQADLITSAERGTGKQLILSCGFGAGASTIQRTAKAGIYGPPQIITLETADAWKTIYREANPRVVQLWYYFDDVLRYMLSDMPDKALPDDFFLPIIITDKKIILPNGLSLDYSSLKAVPVPEWDMPRLRNFIRLKDGDQYYSEFTITHHNETSKIYGGKFTENIVQALARVIVSDAIYSMRRCVDSSKRISEKICMTSHDELVFICDRQKVDDLKPLIEYHMVQSPKWIKGLPLPLGVEMTVSERYEK